MDTPTPARVRELAARMAGGLLQFPVRGVPRARPTLISTGGKARCDTRGCGRVWGYNRESSPCAEPTTHHLVDAEGTEALICDGHAIDARKRLIGGRIEPL